MQLSRFALPAALALAALPAAAQTRAPSELQQYQVSADSNRTIRDGCVYRSTVTGTMQAPAAGSDEGAVRDADLHARGVIECNGRAVSSRDDHIVMASTTVAALNDRLTKAIAIHESDRPCSYSNRLRIADGRVHVDQPYTVCKVVPVAGGTAASRQAAAQPSVTGDAPSRSAYAAPPRPSNVGGPAPASPAWRSNDRAPAERGAHARPSSNARTDERRATTPGGDNDSLSEQARFGAH